jgi:hypothetical protein
MYGFTGELAGDHKRVVADYQTAWTAFRNGAALFSDKLDQGAGIGKIFKYALVLFPVIGQLTVIEALNPLTFSGVGHIQLSSRVIF